MDGAGSISASNLGQDQSETGTCGGCDNILTDTVPTTIRERLETTRRTRPTKVFANVWGRVI